MQATIVLDNIRLTLHKTDGPDEEVQMYGIGEHFIRRMLDITKEYGVGSEGAHHELLDLANEIANSYLIEPAPDDHHWEINFEVWASIDGMKIAWEEL